MNLVVDIGNTLIKMAVFQEGKLLKKKMGLRQDLLKNLEEIFTTYPQIDHAIVSSVAKTASKAIQKIEERCKLFLLDQQLPQVFLNKYATPLTLGQDRIALASAASLSYPNQNVLVIDAGTCITYDFLNANNEYLGGAISPGLQMRYKAMHTFTDRLPLLEPEEEVTLVGNSTKNSMHAGVILGITGEIDQMITAYRAQNKDLTVILTGGDAQILCKRLKNSIFANSNFLLEGLNYILEFNKSQ
ncbi:type III pantothenate kinase [Antarcticibacterium arcticum]|uniref:Type III pantothenate kinase n=1 Tax=Antarcticibacterium arcticum TaxID=2585771 RepID=A0A5B8YKJ0_9FLAO|nr:type III pantothenate kinase [Antarcticibacterium arcticum]QED38204.1 type III pantothenate kinase [Antarcticibacterium arcticum]